MSQHCNNVSSSFATETTYRRVWDLDCEAYVSVYFPYWTITDIVLRPVYKLQLTIRGPPFLVLESNCGVYFGEKFFFI